MTCTVPAMVLEPLLVPTKAGMLPDPLDGKPMAELEFVHEKELLVTLLTKFTGEVLYWHRLAG